MRTKFMATHRSAGLIATVVIAVAGCVGAGAEAGKDRPTIQVEDAWARPSPGTASRPVTTSGQGANDHATGESAAAHGAGPNSAVYMTIRNVGRHDDRLIEVQGDAADAVELHRSTVEDGIMRMRRIDSALVPARGELRLEPGGYHVMLIGLREPLLQGDTVALTLRFEHSGAVEVRAPVESRLLVH